MAMALTMAMAMALVMALMMVLIIVANGEGKSTLRLISPLFHDFMRFVRKMIV